MLSLGSKYVQRAKIINYQAQLTAIIDDRERRWMSQTKTTNSSQLFTIFHFRASFLFPSISINLAMTNFHHLPSSIVAHIFTFSSSPLEILQLRITSRSFNSVLTGPESETIWQNALVLDFDFQLEDVKGGPNHLLQAPRINCQRKDGNRETSIFGYHFSDASGIFLAGSAFESWRHWCKARSIFYDKQEQDDAIIDILEDLHDGDIEVEHTMNGPYFLRAARLWCNLSEWCSSDDSGAFGDRLIRSFEPGVRHYEGRFANCRRNRPFHAYEAIFAFCDGQLTMTAEMASFKEVSTLGLFGGYNVYEHAQCTRLCSTADAVLSKPLDGHIVLGCNFLTRSYRVVTVNLRTHALNAMNGSMDEYPACREEIGKQDIGLLWMEEFVRRITKSEITPVRGNLGNGFQFEWMSLFPSQLSPATSVSCTKGIQVIASSVTAFEIGTVVYSLRIRLLEHGEEGYILPAERGFKTCQLQTRHWRITDTIQDDLDEVNGDGVVGRFPMLFEGGYRDDGMLPERIVSTGEEQKGSFIYQSCAGIKQGTFEGRIKFVPGSIECPSGAPFFVDVRPFSLSMEPVMIY